MKHEQATAEIQETAALYALGSLNQHEMREFEFHLGEGCPICRAEAGRFEKVVAEMAMGVAERNPPSYIRDLLAARIDKEPRAVPAPVQTEAPRSEVVEKNVPAAAPSLILSQPAPDRSLLTWFISVACAVAAILSIYAWRRSESAKLGFQESAHAAQVESDQLRAILEAERGRAREWEPIFAALTERGTKIILLSGQAAAPTAAAAVIWAAGKEQWIFSGRFPPPPPGKTYQLWLLTPRVKINAALLKTDGAGHSFAKFEVPQDLARQVTQAEVTMEPEEGSALPSWPIYAIGKAGP